MSHLQWLLTHAAAPIRYALTRDASIHPEYLSNPEVSLWLGKLTERAIAENLNDIHGSHDYRYENIIGKCYILGMHASIPEFDAPMRFFIDYLDRHINEPRGEAQTFGRLYANRDYETILVCYLPLLGYASEECVRHIAKKRVDSVYKLASIGSYNVYNPNNTYPGAKKDWKEKIIDPALYEDGNLPIPEIHDIILMAGMYGSFGEEYQSKVEQIIEWLYGEGYSQINGGLVYYAKDDPLYKSKAINRKAIPADLEDFHMYNFLYRQFIFSHFKTAREHPRYRAGLEYLESFKTTNGTYILPKTMLKEQSDAYAVSGGHMSAGENNRSKSSREITSTYWMHKINVNIK